MRESTYFDYASMAPPASEALDAMREAALASWGQPGALHSIGQRALYALETARVQVASYVATTWQEIVFTPSGSAALAVAMAQGLARVPKGAVIAASPQDHPALVRLVEAAAAAGYDVRWLAMPGGVPSVDDRRALGEAALVALSACSHELGTSVLDGLAEVPASAVRVIDAVQLAPWVSLAPLNDERTFYAISGAKLGAPLGIGAARVPSAAFYAARESGAPLETECAPWLMAIGLGAACEARAARREEYFTTARARADALLDGLRGAAPGLVVNGALDARLGPLLNVSLPGQYGKALAATLSLEGVCISHTAACQARRSEVSPVVRAAYPEEPARAEGATRWSVSERTTPEDIARAVEAITRIVARHVRTP